MTQFSDGVAVGGVVAANLSSGVGIATAQEWIYDVVPLTKQAANIVASAIVNGSATLTAGTGVTSTVRPDGTTALVLDVPRNVIITGNTGGSSVTWTIKGYDVYGQAMSEAITGPTTSTAAGKKAFKQIVSVSTSGTTTSAMTVGTGDVFGLPIRCDHSAYLSPKFGTVTGSLALDSGTFAAADTTSPATTTTGDVRGTYAPSGSSDGSKRLVISCYIPAAQQAAIKVNDPLVFGNTQA